jgi:aminoglycoside phosphotransferase (APT) family kinase protein
MRNAKALNLERVAISALAVAGFGRPQALEQIPTGMSNHVFVARFARADTVVVRIPRRSHARFAVERAVMDTCRQAGIPVPRVFAVIDAEELHDAPVMLLEHLPGMPLATVSAGLDRHRMARLAQQVGKILAAIHAIPIRGGFGPLDARLAGGSQTLSEWFIDDLTPQLEAARAALHDDPLARASLASIYELLVSHRALLDACPPGLLHGDYRPGNILVADGSVVGIIDWESARSGPAALDFGWWDWWASTHGVPFSTDALLHAYAQVRPIDGGRIAVVRQLSGLRILAGHCAWAAAAGDRDAFEIGRRHLLARMENDGGQVR